MLYVLCVYVLLILLCFLLFFFFKQKTAYEMLISDWSSDVFSSDLLLRPRRPRPLLAGPRAADGALAPGAAGRPLPGTRLRGAGDGAGGAEPAPGRARGAGVGRSLPCVRAQPATHPDRQRGAGAAADLSVVGRAVATLRTRAGAAAPAAGSGRRAHRRQDRKSPRLHSRP